LSDSSKSRGVPPLLALTMGDPAGVGLELTIKLWQAATRDLSTPEYAIVLYADPAAVAGSAMRAGLPDPVTLVSHPRQARSAWPRNLPVIPINLARPSVPGRPDTSNASAVIASIEKATAAVVSAGADALVTNPIAKSILKEAGFPHPGHTEFLAELAHRFVGGSWRPVMLLAAEELRVVPLTVHVPLAAVPGLLSQNLILETARTLAAALVRDFGINRDGGPRIAIAGLNPHAGESGTMGSEEQTIIAPAVAALQAEGLSVTGPHSADTLFHRAARSRYDAVVAMYHDQALIPIKTIAFESAVNVTLGLPFVRTSPDHGTAFDIAGTGRASPTSLEAAVRLAARLATNRARSGGP
jgi:4-hydroxythreonine-4-phosphate dehydrogenase